MSVHLVRVDLCDPRVEIRATAPDERGRTVRFIPSKLADNPHVNPEYAADLKALPEKLRASAEAIGAILVATPSGERIPLARLADVQQVEGPSTITREWGQRRIVVTCNIRGRDMGSFVAEAQRQINADTLKLRGRYHLAWGGQFENYERARRRDWNRVADEVVSLATQARVRRSPARRVRLSPT